ncbi:glycoside hydrolase superfamily [Zopfochytrium polystomum]|nr:glycoside hydrolase superfamily [Zopfochytrium polystomum]
MVAVHALQLHVWSAALLLAVSLSYSRPASGMPAPAQSDGDNNNNNDTPTPSSTASVAPTADSNSTATISATATTAAPSTSHHPAQQRLAAAAADPQLNLCGMDAIDATVSCGARCPLGSDEECPPGLHCFAISDIFGCATRTTPVLPTSNPDPPPSPKYNLCGATADAAARCGFPCPSGSDDACPLGESCFTVEALGCPVDPLRARKWKVSGSWGQDKTVSGGGQLDLQEYCRTRNLDRVHIAYASVFGSSAAFGADNTDGVVVDLTTKGRFNSSADAGAASGVFARGSDGSSPRIERDIRFCQAAGVKVIITLGGPGGDYGLQQGQGAAVGRRLYDLFLNKDSPIPSENRPFGAAVLNGFELDLENKRPSPEYATLVTTIFQLSQRQALFFATPKCSDTDGASNYGDLLTSRGVSTLPVRFFDDPTCSVGKSGFSKAVTQWASSRAVSRGSLKFELGVAAAATDASDGVPQSASALQSAVSTARTGKSNFGGVMIWDVSAAYERQLQGQSVLDFVAQLAA